MQHSVVFSKKCYTLTQGVNHTKKVCLWIRGIKEMWEVLNDILIAGGIVTLLFGGSLVGLIVWITRKPRVHLLSEISGGWCYLYKDGKDISKTNILLSLALENKGREGTPITVSLETADNNRFYSDDMIYLAGKTSTETKINLNCDLQNKILNSGEHIQGIVKIEPKGNRRLLIFGKRYITNKVDIFENQALIYQSTYRNQVNDTR